MTEKRKEMFLNGLKIYFDEKNNCWRYNYNNHQIFSDDCKHYEEENGICDNIIYAGECNEDCLNYCIEHYPHYFMKEE